jgi:cytidylate kinase
MKTYDLSRSEAEESVKEKERQRASVASKIFETDVNDPKLYHVILNTSLVPFDWGVEMAAVLVSHFLARERS